MPPWENVRKKKHKQTTPPKQNKLTKKKPTRQTKNKMSSSKSVAVSSSNSSSDGIEEKNQYVCAKSKDIEEKRTTLVSCVRWKHNGKYYYC